MLKELVNYNYYINNYGGSSIPGSSFFNLSVRASAYVNKYTYHRINNENINDAIRDSACEIADLLYSQDIKKEKKENNKMVASETVGPHSKTYVNNSGLIDKQILTESELESSCYNICYKHIVSTGLMYRGF